MRCSPAGCDLEMGQRLTAAAAAPAACVKASLTRKTASAGTFQNKNRPFTRVHRSTPRNKRGIKLPFNYKNMFLFTLCYIFSSI